MSCESEASEEALIALNAVSECAQANNCRDDACVTQNCSNELNTCLN